MKEKRKEGETQEDRQREADSLSTQSDKPAEVSLVVFMFAASFIMSVAWSGHAALSLC